MKNKYKIEIKIGFELLIELLIFYFMFIVFDINKQMSISFERYLFVFITVFIMIRDKYHNNLIWQDAKNLGVFYFMLFIISLVLRPMKYITSSQVISNLLFFTLSYIVTLFSKKVIHMALFDKLADNVLIIGIGHHAETIATACRANRYSLMNVKGFLSCDESKIKLKQEHVVEENVVAYKDLDSFISNNDIDVALLAIPQLSKTDITRISNDLRGKVKQIKYMPQINSMYSYDARIEDYDGMLLICNKETKNELYTNITKRIIDIFAGICGSIILLPLTLIIKILNLINGDKGPIIFKQERIGINGKKIVIYKYRSMVMNAEAILEELMKNNPEIKKEYLKNKKLENDPRITKVGQFIRKTSLDEFPQFINVLKGEMSLVGPRPYLFREIKDMGSFYDSIILTKPGITGMWQVSGRSDIAFDRRCRLDEYYAKNQGFWLDFTIVVKTIKAILTSSGAM